MPILATEPFNSLTASDPLASLVTNVVSDIVVDALGEQLFEEQMPASHRGQAQDAEGLETAIHASVALDMGGEFSELTAPQIMRSGNVIGRIEPVAGQNQYASAA